MRAARGACCVHPANISQRLARLRASSVEQAQAAPREHPRSCHARWVRTSPTSLSRGASPAHRGTAALQDLTTKSNVTLAPTATRRTGRASSAAKGRSKEAALRHPVKRVQWAMHVDSAPLLQNRAQPDGTEINPDSGASNARGRAVRAISVRRAAQVAPQSLAPRGDTTPTSEAPACSTASQAREGHTL